MVKCFVEECGHPVPGVNTRAVPGATRVSSLAPRTDAQTQEKNWGERKDLRVGVLHNIEKQERHSKILQLHHVE